MSITITLPDSRTIPAQAGESAYDILGRIGAGLQKAALAARLDGTLVDLSTPVTADTKLSAVTFDDAEGRDIFWHSASHLMAQAIRRLFPGVKLAIGPSIDNGFYYDIELDRAISPDDLPVIEAEMATIAAENLTVTREELSRADAIALFEKDGERFKVEMLGELAADRVSIYRQGDFYDLCRGPHVPRTACIKAVKLTSIAGAYWRGDERNSMLQRIYGTAFPDQKRLKAHLDLIEEAKKRDHRRLGREMDLFSVHDDAGSGLIYWHPKGGRLRAIIEEWWRQEHFRYGYELLFTPHIGRSTLWETSGHLGFYAENMYAPMRIDDHDYYIKPMNCPFHIKIYQTKLHSYRDLPLRWAELGTVYRYEKSGVLHGMMRVRGFTQDDAHIFCTPDQIESEVREVLRFSLRMWQILGFTEIKAYLATKPAKSVGEPERWEQAQQSLLAAVKAENLAVEMDEGGGAFYGPKIDLKVRDALNREWQMTTIQFDFNLPERFDLFYIGEDGQRHRPYMVHRALLGSIERFVGILIEHYAGRFPVWLSPVQVILTSVSSDEAELVRELRERFLREGLRVETDIREESIGYKIRDAIGKKVPFIGVLGKKEAESGMISVRKRGENASSSMTVLQFVDMVHEDEIQRR